MKKYVLFALLGIGVLSSCKNDLDVLAPYKDITVVYGLLNQKDTIHYIKINKAYLGEGNAYLMAGISDSVNYTAADIDVKIEEYNNGVLSNTFPLVRTVNEVQKDTGLFATDANILYRFDNTLNANRNYKLLITNNKTGAVISSKTNLISDITVSIPQTNQNVNLVGNNNSQFTIKFTSAKNAMVYSVVVRFKYTEENTTTAEVTTHTLDWKLPNIKSLTDNGGEVLLMPLEADGFYQLMATQLTQAPANIKRHSGRFEFIFYAGGKELSTYLDVNGPSNTLQQEKPEYTNITNGLGIFSSRFNKSETNIQFSPQSLDSLLNGRFTKDLGFVN